MREIVSVHAAPRQHWVGDGFPVRTVLSHHDQGADISPFLMLDHAGPAQFAPTRARRGVGAHPHKGFETVTIVYQGEVEHRDSTGAGGIIGPGDVQWMTAGAGIVHEEFHSPAFAARGGTFEVAQLWVNLPKRMKGVPAGYQSLTSADIPVLDLPDAAGRLRVIAGELSSLRGPAHTHTPITIADLDLHAGKSFDAAFAEGHTALVVVLSGTVQVAGRAGLLADQMAILAREGGSVRIEAASAARVLLLSGEPIREPVAAHGPFVMNSIGEIKQAMLDFQNGRFGAIGP